MSNRKLEIRNERLEIKHRKITEKIFGKFLDTRNIPDPDIIVRTSGEQRLSNFLIWEASYAEYFFTETLWPDFGKKEFAAVLRRYAQRKRRFGGI